MPQSAPVRFLVTDSRGSSREVQLLEYQKPLVLGAGQLPSLLPPLTFSS